MRILVTGSKGQLGSELMSLLGGGHHEVLGVDLDNGDATVDLTDRDAVLGCLTTWRPDAVIHGAAYTAVDRCEVDIEGAYRLNAMATRFVADGARQVGAHVVYVSTDYVFDGTKSGPYLEWDVPNPQSVYGASKLAGEHEIDPGWSIARTSWVCGRHGNNMVKTVLNLAAQRDTFTFVDDQVGHPTFAQDLAAMLVQLAVGRLPGVYHTTNQGAVSWYGFVREILAAAGLDPDRVSPVSTEQYLGARPADAPPMAPRPANSVLGDMAWVGAGLARSRDFREPLAEVVAALRAG